MTPGGTCARDFAVPTRQHLMGKGAADLGIRNNLAFESLAQNGPSWALSTTPVRQPSVSSADAASGQRPAASGQCQLAAGSWQPAIGHARGPDSLRCSRAKPAAAPWFLLTSRIACRSTQAKQAHGLG